MPQPAERAWAGRAWAERGWAGLADDVERIFGALRDTAAAFQASYAARAGEYTLDDIASLRPRIRATLDSFPEMAVGTGIVAAPGVVRDAPYWLEWWWRQSEGTLEALRVNLDPDGPDFFDYVNAEWFEAPIRCDHGHVTGPYVDYACTNLYTFTLSVPVYHDGRPLGVAAMDIPFDQLEHRILPALCAEAVESAPRVLLNANGRVIAASGAGPAPGDQLAGRRGLTQTQPSDALTRLCDLTGWTLALLCAPEAGEGPESGFTLDVNI